MFSATLPKEAGIEKYDARFKATLAVHKYFLGLPFYRMERMQSYLGVPLPDSTQWQLVEQLADNVYPVFYYLEYLGAQGKAIFIDDTGVKIISVKLAIKDNPQLKRTGTFTTAIISKVDEHKIYLFYSGKKHAGAALDNNCCEEILKIPIRVRKNSAFFATLDGAFLGSMLTSLIVTAARADVNPIEYLSVL